MTCALHRGSIVICPTRGMLRGGVCAAQDLCVVLAELHDRAPIHKLGRQQEGDREGLWEAGGGALRDH